MTHLKWPCTCEPKGISRFYLRQNLRLLLTLFESKPHIIIIFHLKTNRQNPEKYHVNGSQTRTILDSFSNPQVALHPFLFSGQQVRRVPANLCRAFRRLIENRLTVSIECHYTGLCGQSINPGPHQRFGWSNVNASQ